MKIGDRVVTPSGVGIVEELDGDMTGVRMLTPHNGPSVMKSWCWTDDLKDGTNVMPQPRSKKWHCEAAMFQQAIEGALRDMLHD